MPEDATTLWVPKSLRHRLEVHRKHPRQSLHEIIATALDALERGPTPVRSGPSRLDPLVTRNRDRLLAAAKENGIARLWLFGSRARGDSGPDSDADLLYEAMPGKSLWDICPFIEDAKEILGVSVDFVDRAALKGDFRDRVAKEAVPL